MKEKGCFHDHYTKLDMYCQANSCLACPDGELTVIINTKIEIREQVNMDVEDVSKLISKRSVGSFWFNCWSQ